MLPMARLQKPLPAYLEPERLIVLLASCTKISEMVQIHGHMIKIGLDLVSYPLSKLLACATLDISYATKIFNQINNPNLFMFNTLLRGYSDSNKPRQAFQLFNTLRTKAISLDQFSFITTLKACTRDMALGTGLAVHGVVVQSGFESYISVRNSLLNFYCAHKRIGDAHILFDMFPQERDLVSWNTLMGGYLRMSQPDVVMNLFRHMHISGIDVDVTTALSVISACGDASNLSGGGSLHGYCNKRGFCSQQKCVTAIVAMYGKNGRMDVARKLFDTVLKKDVILWNCFIKGYAANGLLEESLSLLREMKLEQVRPNTATLAGVLKTCASMGALAVGESIHKYIEDESLELNEILGTALLDMYSKCGLITKAVDVFEQMQSKDVGSWTAMVAGYGVNGLGVNAIQLFRKMEEMAVMPNEVTFLAVLTSCNHAGLVAEGKYFFDRMVRVYGFLPGIEHYGCVLDSFGRAGLLDEAYSLIKSLPIERDPTAWRAMLAACRAHGNVELGETAKRALVDLGDEHPTDSILLCGSYAIHGRWDDIAKMREEVTTRKEVGWSSIGVDDQDQLIDD